MKQKALTQSAPPGVEIRNEKPPAWIMDGCMSSFRVSVDHTVWTYGNVIFNPGGQQLPDHIIVHEATHMRQQAEIGKDEWWKRFLIDPAFRVEQEAQAYSVQYGFFCGQVHDRNKRALFLRQLASHLSGPLYQTSLSHAEAVSLIRDNAPNFK
jgi:hypothetical protein